MKSKIIFSMLLLSGALVYSQVGINTRTPEATLDIRATNHLGPVTAKDGLLVPRVNALSVNGTANGQLVYLIADAGSSTKGFYFWNGTQWAKMGAGTGDTSKDAWVDDPAGAMVKLGTKSTGTARDASTDVVVLDNGNVGIGNTAPRTKLDIRNNPGNNVPGNGAFAIGNTPLTAVNAGAGAVRYNDADKRIEYSNGTTWNILTGTIQKSIVVAKKITAQSFQNQVGQNVTNWAIVTDLNQNFNSTTGEFTAPRNGNYSVAFSFNFNAASINAGTQVEAILVSVGTMANNDKKSVVAFPAAGTSQAGAAISFVLKMNAGDKVRPLIWHDTGNTKSLRIPGTAADDGFVNFSVAEL